MWPIGFSINPPGESRGINVGFFHTGSARGSARISSRARAEPLVWTSCSSDKKFQACTENPSWTLFTLKARLRLGSGSAQDFLSWAPSLASVKHPMVTTRSPKVLNRTPQVMPDGKWPRTRKMRQASFFLDQARGKLAFWVYIFTSIPVRFQVITLVETYFCMTLITWIIEKKLISLHFNHPQAKSQALIKLSFSGR